LLLLPHRPRHDPARGIETALIADRVAANYLKADLTPREKAILDFAMKATLQSHHVDEQDFVPLRAHALDEEDICVPPASLHEIDRRPC
jgi:alkylhydroperoxidase family enzyme